MPPEKGSPQDWLIHAESDLQLAVTGKSPKVLFETLCFHTQQVAEKLNKSRFNRKWCSFHQNSQYRHVGRNVAQSHSVSRRA
jgi:hypothetical protein